MSKETDALSDNLEDMINRLSQKMQAGTDDPGAHALMRALRKSQAEKQAEATLGQKFLWMTVLSIIIGFIGIGVLWYFVSGWCVLGVVLLMWGNNLKMAVDLGKAVKMLVEKLAP